MTGISSIRVRFKICLVHALALATAVVFVQSFCLAEPKTMSEEELGKLLRKAENGSLNAQAELARAYAVGRAGNINYEEAVRWYRRAADQGDPDSQTNLEIVRAHV